MVQLEIELPDEKLGWLGFVEENIAVEESLRLHFYGFLSEDRSLTNLVMIELPEGLKLRKNSRLRRKEYESRRLMGSLPELPFWKKIGYNNPWQSPSMKNSGDYHENSLRQPATEI